mmetsp:Transcript_101269/g.315006  ORF Transcript_101269/g.315006 Transcript_101269/m.315006 type:complete len:118 (-) Transcript_101269:3-356(-)
MPTLARLEAPKARAPASARVCTEAGEECEIQWRARWTRPMHRRSAPRLSSRQGASCQGQPGAERPLRWYPSTKTRMLRQSSPASDAAACPPGYVNRQVAAQLHMELNSELMCDVVPP